VVKTRYRGGQWNDGTCTEKKCFACSGVTNCNKFDGVFCKECHPGYEVYYGYCKPKKQQIVIANLNLVKDLKDYKSAADACKKDNKVLVSVHSNTMIENIRKLVEAYGCKDTWVGLYWNKKWIYQDGSRIP